MCNGGEIELAAKAHGGEKRDGEGSGCCCCCFLGGGALVEVAS